MGRALGAKVNEIMALAKLTDKEILAFSKKGKDGWLGDGGNLSLRLRGESVSWFFRFKVPKGADWDKPGKAIECGLGPYPARTLKSARILAGEMREDLQEKRDPRERLRPPEPEDAEAFEKWATDFIANREAEWKSDKHRQQWRNTLRDYVYGELGSKPVGEITRDDVERVLRPLWADEKYETFSRVRMRIEAVLSYAFDKLDIDRANPAQWQLLQNRFGKLGKRKKVKSHAAPPWRDVPAIMANLRAKPEVVSALALRFSILTAARSGEVRALTWPEIDLEGKVWRLPGERSKNGDAHDVPLNAEALAILDAAKAHKREGCDRVFPGGNGGVLSDVAIIKQLDAAIGYEHEPGGERPATAHGIARSSFRDWIAEATSFPDKVAEAALNHTNPNATEAAYLRTKFFDQRVKLMAAWGDFLAGTNNVIQLKNAG